MGFLIDGKSMEYVSLISEESVGIGHFGINIDIASDNMPDLKSEECYELIAIARKASETIRDELNRFKNKNNPSILEKTAREREQILSAFDKPIYVEEIPNGYCSDWCCEHLPWFIITTKVGRIKIGWRKMVISIDWSDIPNSIKSVDLFPDEDVTKFDNIIHAWGIDEARQYVQTIIGAHHG